MPLFNQAAGGSVTSVTAADTSVVVGGTGAAPTVATATLDVIAADHPAAADWSNNSHKITSLTNGGSAQDAAAYGQTPAGGTTVTIAQGGTGTGSTSQNFAFAGPTSGSGAPSFRALVAGDLPIVQDPLKLGASMTMLQGVGIGGVTNAGTGNNGWYHRLISGGYSLSHVGINVVSSSGNISVAAYTTSGGATPQPTGTQLATSGAVACPANGAANVSVGSTIAPNLADWFGISADNASATISGITGVTASNLPSGLSYTQATAHPLPSTPSSLSASNLRFFSLRGS